MLRFYLYHKSTHENIQINGMSISNETLGVKYTDPSSKLDKSLYGKFVPRKAIQQWGWIDVIWKRS